MRKVLFYMLLVSCFFTLLGCKSSKNNKSTANYTLTDTQWNLVSINKTDISHDFALRPFIVFDSSGTVHGNLGCNSFFGNYSLYKKQKINIEYTGATKRLCQKMEVEKSFIGALKNDIDNYQIVGDELILFNGKDEVLRFSGVNLKEVE